MGKTKKILSLFLSLVMVLLVSAIPAMAENNARIVGVGTIYAPPAGTVAELPIKLLDAEGNVLENTTIAISNSNVKGVYKSGTSLIVDGDEITAGSFTLTATSGDVTASKEVTVSDVIWYEDFEDVTIPTGEGETVSVTETRFSKMDGTESTTSVAMVNALATATVLSEENGNQYANGDGITLPTSSISTGATTITIEALMRKPGYTTINIGRFGNNSYTIDKAGGSAVYLRLQNNVYTGGIGSSGPLATTYGSVLNETWVNVRVEIDSVNAEIAYYENGACKLSATKEEKDALTAMLLSRLQDIRLGVQVDDIHIYTGKRSENSALGSISGADKIAAPKAGEYSKYDGYKVLSGEGAVIENAILTYKGNIPGVKFENGALYVNGSTVRAGSFTLTGIGSSGPLATTYGSVLNETWVNVRVEIDSVNAEIAYYENGACKLSATKEEKDALTAMLLSRLQDIRLGVQVDDIHIYTGKRSENSALGSISGADKIAAPKAGEYSKYDGYKVLSGEGAVIENAILTYKGNIPGVKFENGALYVNGSTVRAGSFTLTATTADGELLAKKQVEILPDRYAEDFDDVTVGENTVTITDTKLVKLDGTASTSSIATNGSVTTNGSNNCATGTIALNTTPFANADVITIKYKAQRPTTSPNYMASFKTNDNKTIEIKYYSDGYLYLRDTGDSNKTHSLGVSTSNSTLYDFTVVLDFVNHTIKVNNGLPKAIASLANSKGLASFSLLQNAYVDDVSYFTGREVSLTPASARLTIPATGESTCSVAATYSDGTPATITSITENYDGITTEGGTIKVASTAAVQPYTFTVSDGLMSADVTFQADKDVVLLNGAAFNNEDLVKGSSNTVSAAFGATDLEAGKRVIIAHYGKDANGKVYLKDVELSEISTNSVKEVTASLTADAVEGDVIKVFKWNWNALAPINSVTID